jgi:hypothetical protein
MPAKTLEEVLGSLSAEERKLFDNTLSKNPELKDGWLRQDDFSRKSAELQARKAEYDEAKAYSERMAAWADQNVPVWEKLAEAGIIDKDTGDELWTAQKTELEKQLEEARKQAVGGDMDPAELDKRVREIVKANGGLTPEEMKAVVASQAKTLAEEAVSQRLKEEEKKFNENTIPFVWGGAAALASSVNRYEKETGKEFTDEDTRKLFELMTERKNYDARSMMSEYMAPIKKVKDTEVEIQRRVQEELAKRGGGMPGGGHEPYIPQPEEKGNLQKMLERSAGEGDFENVIAAQAVKAAQELRAAGK